MASVIKLKISVSLLDNVLAHFNRIKVYRADSIDGTYAEITTPASRIPIIQGTTVYLFDDSTGDPDYWYKTAYYHTDTLLESDLSDPRQGEDFSIDSLVMSVQDLKDIYLYGLDLTDDAGNPYPDVMFEWSINFALDWIEKELDIRVRPTEFDERYDYYRRDFSSYMFLQLREFPVISVEEVALQWPAGEKVLTFPDDWISLRADEGQINIVPTAGNFESLMLTQGGSVLPLMAAGRDFVPDMIRVQYTAGYALGAVPMAIRELIGKKASFGPLNIAGDLLGGAGIASQSIGIDGLSQSYNTTSSATNAGYGARLLQYGKEIKEQLQTLRRYYKGIRMVAV